MFEYQVITEINYELAENRKRGLASLKSNYDIMINQIREIDNRRLTSKVGELPGNIQLKVKENIKLIPDLE